MSGQGRPVVAYLRQSLGRAGESAETSLSMESQLDEIVAWIRRSGHRLEGVVRDHDESGRTMARPGFRDELIPRAAATPGGIVAVWKYDRFARNLLGQEEAVRDLERAGVEVVSVSEPAGKLPRQLLGSVAEYYADLLSDRIRAAREVQARRGHFTGSVPPFGYRRPGVAVIPGPGGTTTLHATGMPAPDADARAVYLDAVARVEGGESPGSVCAGFHARGILRPGGGPWELTVMLRMLRNPFHAGRIVHRGRIVGDGLHEPLIDRARWERLQETLERRPTIRVPTRSGLTSWVEGLVHHACGARMYLTPVGGKLRIDGTRSVYPNFVCRRSTGVRRCGVAQIVVSAPKAEWAAIRLLQRALAEALPLDLAVAHAAAAAGGGDAADRRTDLADRRRIAERRLERARRIWIEGDGDLAAWEADRARYRGELDGIDAAARDLPAPPDLAAYAAAAAALGSFAALVPTAADAGLAAILRELGGIVVSPAGIALRCRPPYDGFLPDAPPLPLPFKV